MNLRLEVEKILINIYQKIGNIAHQIESLRKVDVSKPVNIVGGFRAEGQEELDRLIKYQWMRIDFLMTLQKRQYFPDIDKIITQFNNTIGDCHRCKESHECEEHFFTKSYISLLELIKT